MKSKGLSLRVKPYTEAQEKEDNLVKVTEEEWPLIQEKNE